MAKMSTGAWAYFIGLALALVLAFMPTLLGTWGLPLLVILGLIVGYLNVKASESVKAILAVIALPVVSVALLALPGIGQFIGPIFQNILAFAGGAAVLIVLKTLHEVLSE